jgi:SAM-dependent methyltransferase
MPSIADNLRLWNVGFDWSHEDWGRSWWGSAAAMWYGFVYPRIWRFLPAPTILEIAPGFGRWTEFLFDHCDTLIGIDIADKCIDACRQRFADRPRAIFETNDGHSLPMAADSSVDFALSLDSLVHVEADPLKGYLTGPSPQARWRGLPPSLKLQRLLHPCPAAAGCLQPPTVDGAARSKPNGHPPG